MTNYMQRWYSYAHFLKNFFFFNLAHFNVFIEFVTVFFTRGATRETQCYNIASVLCFGFFFWPWGKSDLSSPTRDLTHTPYIGRWSLNYWTVREKPCMLNFEVTGVTYLWEQPHRCSWKEKGCQLIKGQTKTVWQDWSPGYQPSSQSSWHLWSR